MRVSKDTGSRFRGKRSLGTLVVVVVGLLVVVCAIGGMVYASVRAGGLFQEAESPAPSSPSPMEDGASGMEAEGGMEGSDAGDEPSDGQADGSAVQASGLDDGSGQRRSAAEIFESLGIVEDYRAEFVHGVKLAQDQRYIVMHDTEGYGDAASVIDDWDWTGTGTAAHFIVNRDGTVWQCVPLNSIAHHAGFGDVGQNETFGVSDESRDDRVGTVAIGSDYPDYGMNSYSIGIEMVHVSGQDYPEEQLLAVDELIAYIDAYYGFESQIIDHNDWRTTNSDCDPNFQGYLANLQDHRAHYDA